MMRTFLIITMSLCSFLVLGLVCSYSLLPYYLRNHYNITYEDIDISLSTKGVTYALIHPKTPHVKAQSLQLYISFTKAPSLLIERAEGYLNAGNINKKYTLPINIHIRRSLFHTNFGDVHLNKADITSKSFNASASLNGNNIHIHTANNAYSFSLENPLYSLQGHAHGSLLRKLTGSIYLDLHTYTTKADFTLENGCISFSSPLHIPLSSLHPFLHTSTLGIWTKNHVQHGSFSIKHFDYIHKKIQGGLHNVALTYLKNMPQVQKINAQWSAENNLLLISKLEGISNGVTIHQGQLYFSKDTANLTLPLSSSLHDALALLRKILTLPPIIKPHGQQKTNLSISFPLSEELAPNEIIVRADSSIQNLSAQVRMDEITLPVRSKNLHINVIPHSTSITGSARIYDYEGTVNILYTDTDKTAQFLTHIDMATLWKKLSGTVPLKLKYAIDTPQKGVSFYAPLVSLNPPASPIHKEKNRYIQGTIKQSAARTIVDTQLFYGNIHAEGSIFFDNTHPASFTLRNAAIEGNTFSGYGHKKDKLWNIWLNSPYIGVSALQKSGSIDFLPPCVIQGYILRTDILNTLSLDNTQYTFISTDNSHSLSAFNNLYSFVYKSEAGGTELTLNVKNAQPLLPAELHKYFSCKGLSMKAQKGKKEEFFTGNIIIHDAYIQKAPALLQLLSLISLESILPAENKGIRFGSIKGTFMYKPPFLAFSSLYFANSSLGITFKGAYNTKYRTIQGNGSIVPANFLNQFLSHLPIVGNILAPGDKKDGIFSISYSINGPLANPDVDSNALSLLAPSVLKKMIG